MKRCRPTRTAAVRSDLCAEPSAGVLHITASVGQLEHSSSLSSRQVWPQRKYWIHDDIYESFVTRLSGGLIVQVTMRSVLSALGQAGARAILAFRANAFGVDVRFRSHDGWGELFAKAGFHVEGLRIGKAEHVAPPRRVRFIRTIRRDSIPLRATASA